MLRYGSPGLALLLLTNIAAAQDPPRSVLEVELDEGQLRGMQARGADLFPLRWKLGENGALLVSAPGTELAEYSPFFRQEGLPAPAHREFPKYVEAVMVAWLVGLHGETDLLGAADAERHLKRLHVDTGDAGLLDYAAATPSSDGELRRSQDLTRALAIDLVAMHGLEDAVPLLDELAQRGGEVPLIRSRAAAAAARLRGRGGEPAEAPFALADLELPAGADMVVVARGSRLPEPHRIRETFRRGILDDFYESMQKGVFTSTAGHRSRCQLLVDYPAELPFELVRRYGNHRVTDVALVIRMVQQGEFAVEATGGGTFDLDSLAAGLARDGVEVESGDGSLTIPELFPGTAAVVRKDRIELRSGRIGRAGGDGLGERLARAGMQPEDGLALWFPTGSKAIAGLAAMGIFNVKDILLSIRFRPTVRIRAVMKMRDEDAAHAVAGGVEDFLQENLGMMGQIQEKGSGAYSGLRPLWQQFADLKAKIVEDSVVLELDGKDLGEEAVRDLIRLVRG